MVLLWMRLAISIPFLFVGAYLQKTFRLPSKNELWPLLIMSFQEYSWFGSSELRNENCQCLYCKLDHNLLPAFVLFWDGLLKRKNIQHGLYRTIDLSSRSNGSASPGFSRYSQDNRIFRTIGDLLILFSSLNWSIFLVFSKKVLKGDLPYSFVLFWEMFFSFIYATLAVLLMGYDVSVIGSFSPKTWTAIAFLGAGASAGAYFCWFHGLSVLPVSRIIAFQFLQPFAGALIAYLLLGEHFTIWLFAGGITIMYGSTW